MAENRGSRAPQLNSPWSFQQSIHQNSRLMAASASQRFNDIHHYVIQGLSPLMNASNLRSVRHPHDHAVWSRHNLEMLQSAQPSALRSSVGSVANTNQQDHVIEIGDRNNDLNSPTFSVEFVDGQPSNSEPNANARPLDTNSENIASPLSNSPEFQMIISFAEKYFPFLLILLMKLVFDHRIGILVNIGLFITFFHANAIVKREVSKQGKRQLTSLLMVFVNLMLCIIVIYAVLGDEGLAYAIIFVAPYSMPISICDVLWIVSVTDFVLRIITIIIKLFILAIPPGIVAFQKKGKYYLFVERSSQLYRTLTPMQHWLYFFSESYMGPSKVFGVILSAAYLIFKCKSIIYKAKMWKQALIKVIQSRAYGVTPSVGQIKEAGDSCPICQDDYKSPSMLQCKHIFCEECVALWFDRERTCPICRAQIADDPSWRDGSTTLMLQIF